MTFRSSWGVIYTHPYRFDPLFSLLSFLVLKTRTQEGRLENKHGDTRAKCISAAAFPRVLHSHLVPSLQPFSLNLCTTTVNYRGYTRFSLSSPWAFHSLFQMLLKGRLFPWVESREERIYTSTTTNKFRLAFAEQAASSRLRWMEDQCQDKINPLFTPQVIQAFQNQLRRKHIDAHMETICCLGGIVPDWFLRCSGLRWGVRTFT